MNPGIPMPCMFQTPNCALTSKDSYQHVSFNERVSCFQPWSLLLSYCLIYICDWLEGEIHGWKLNQQWKKTIFNSSLFLVYHTVPQTIVVVQLKQWHWSSSWRGCSKKYKYKQMIFLCHDELGTNACKSVLPFWNNLSESCELSINFNEMPTLKSKDRVKAHAAHCFITTLAEAAS